MPDVECPPVALPQVDPPAPDELGPSPGAACPETGPLVAIPRKHCLVFDAYGAVVGLTTEYQTYRLPPCTVPYGDPFCVTDEVCCASTWYCVEGVCTEVPYGEAPPDGAYGPFDDEAACEANNVARWYCVEGVCTEVAACEAPPAGAAGPFADEATCEAAGCEDADTVATDCSPYPVRKTLYATAAGVGTIILKHDGGTDWSSTYFGSVRLLMPECDVPPAGVGGFDFVLECADLGGGLHEWRGGDPSGGGGDPPVSVSLDPFELVFEVPLNETLGVASPCYGTVYTITVTD